MHAGLEFWAPQAQHTSSATTDRLISELAKHHI